MVTFIIPVKSASVSNNWDLFSKLFERTLRSVCSQTSKDYKVIVVCHEIPQVDFKDDRIDYITVNFDPPDTKETNLASKIALLDEDKSKKILKGLEKVNQTETSYVMVLDSDDCISKKLVETVINSDPQICGWYMKKGYIYKEGSSIIFRNNKNFNTLCGSSIIIKPHLISKLFKNETQLFYSHEMIEIDEVTHLQPFPDPVVIYSIANRENILMTKEQSISYNTSYTLFSVEFFKSIIRKVRKYRPILLTPYFRRRFGLSKINFQ